MILEQKTGRTPGKKAFAGAGWPAAFAAYLEATGRGASAGAYAGEVGRLESWFTGQSGEFRPCSVTPLDLAAYRGYLQSRPGRRGMSMAPATVNKILAYLHVFFGWLKETGQVADNPVDQVARVTAADGSAGLWLTGNQEAALVRTVREGGSPRDWALVGLMLYAGLRIGEVCGLGRRDIEISGRKGLVRVCRRGRCREVPLTGAVRRAVADCLRVNPRGPVFPNKRGGPIGVGGVEKLFARYARRANLEGVTPRTLRHTFCRKLIDRGGPVDRVATLAGHSRPAVTRRYTAP